MSMSQKIAMLKQNNKQLSIRQQCALLQISRSQAYYQPAGESEENLLLMQLLDEEYTRHPFRGVLSMVSYLNDLGYSVNHKRVRRLLRLMGNMAIYPKKRTSISNQAHKKYPYLIKGLRVNKANQVWCTDITYIRLSRGFIYLVAIMDWYSRYVLSWQLSNSLDTSFCLEAVEDAMMLYGFPEIFNSDQGCQFTSKEFTGLLEANHIKISMDGRGRAFDNIFIERLWRSVKYEEVYLYGYETVAEARAGLDKYFKYYNYGRHHQKLENKKPAELYFNHKIPVDYMNFVDNNILVPRRITHKINVGPQEVQ